MSLETEKFIELVCKFPSSELHEFVIRFWSQFVFGSNEAHLGRGVFSLVEVEVPPGIERVRLHETLCQLAAGRQRAGKRSNRNPLHLIE